MNKPDRGNIDELVIDQCKQLLRCIHTKDIAGGNRIIESLKTILDSTIDEITLVFDTPKIQYPGKSFCLTGYFDYGDREEVVEAIVERDGKILNSVSVKLDYLIVGDLGSEDWSHKNYGRKIEKALALREKKKHQIGIYCPAIIHESHWVKSL